MWKNALLIIVKACAVSKKHVHLTNFTFLLRRQILPLGARVILESGTWRQHHHHGSLFAEAPGEQGCKEHWGLVSVDVWSSNLYMRLGNREAAGHPAQIAMSDRIKDSIPLIAMFLCSWWMRMWQEGHDPVYKKPFSGKQEDCFVHVLILNVLISCAS